ncbi:hypothetical protein BA919_01610 [Helicobacter pullorum]|nr:hypothetical protein BA919_01610 [Helicobacter pullorum]
MWLQKIFNFIKSKTFILIMLFIALVVMSLSFWFWGPLIAFNEVYIFGSGYLRFGIILIVWVIIFFSFLMKPIINFFASLKSKKRLKLKEFKKEANEFLFRAKRNFSISLRRKEYLEKRYKNEKFAIIYQTPSKKTLTCLSKR